MNILITGSSGFLGRRAADLFSSLGHQILAPSHAELDITDEAAADTWILKHRPQAVLHCAAVSDTGACQREPERTARINITGSVNLARSCEKTGAKFLFCSSDQVYAGSALPGPHSESEVLTPNTAYARQKLQAEQLCRAACHNTVSLRLSWMYAARSLPDEHGHLMTFLCSALRDSSISITRSDRDFRGITDVDSVVHQLPAALNLPAGVYNFGAANDLDTYNTLRAVFRELELPDMLCRLTPDPQCFSRDIRMDGSLAAAHGIVFESTAAGLCRALSQFL